MEQIKMETKGGECMGSGKIKERLKSYIQQVYAKKKKLDKLPANICDHTLNSFVSTVKAQCIFNLYDNVSNKTESRRAAEWSLRSTLAYSTIVTCTHFISLTSPSKYHVKKTDLNEEACQLWNLAESCYNTMIGKDGAKVSLYPILPNLITTTDEVTIFATVGNVHTKESFYLVSRPEEIKNEACNSGARNCYTTKQVGDSHFRGVRIVINSTFTAGGLAAPIFVAVYGLTLEEMPTDEMITIEVPGLVSGAHQNLYGGGAGFITFVRGALNIPVDSNSETANTTNDESSNSPLYLSKESRVAHIYREKVYHPFIKKIRKDKYGFDGNDDEIPESLRAVSWMDGCASQLRLITSENNMKVEHGLKITCNKHSASRTAVEQAADCGAMFKVVKRVNNDTELPHASNNSLYHQLQQTLLSMESQTELNTKVLRLLSHKKKEISITVAKLPIAAASAYTDKIIKKAFILNGQLDMTHKLVPSLNNLLNTYRGDIQNTSLTSGDELIKRLYEEAYTQGMIAELTFDSMNIPLDKKTSGDIVDRNVGIQLENRQRSKVLSSVTQIQERKKHLHGIRMKEHDKKIRCFEAEERVYMLNANCENKLATYHANETADTQEQSSSNIINSQHRNQDVNNGSFREVADLITYDTVKKYGAKMTKIEMVGFVQTRSSTKMRGGKISYLNVPKNRSEIFERLWQLHNVSTKARKYPIRPIPPQMT